MAGKWLPEDKAVLSGWVNDLIKEVYGENKLSSCPAPLDPSILKLKDLIETDPEIYMLFTEMFIESPLDPNPVSRIYNYTQMLTLMNHIITKAPRFDGPHCPINALFLYPMATPAGTMAFLNDKVNKCFQEILCTWAKFLDDSKSRYVLDRTKPNGWLSKAALEKMPNFESTFVINTNDERYWGFKSWNDFFSRKLQPGVRPLPTDADVRTVVAACESTPYRIRKGAEVNFRDAFWIKNQPYSLQHMLNNDPYTESFVGGTIYQYFLSTYNYHRWHAPVDGTIERIDVPDGSYYAEALSIGFDPTADTESQSYLTNVDKRAIFFIKADSDDVGVVALVMVGMAEIASLKIDVCAGQKVKKGDPLGTFQFGGSSYVMCFQRGVNVKFIVDPIPENPCLVKVNSKLAQVEPPE